MNRLYRLLAAAVVAVSGGFVVLAQHAEAASCTAPSGFVVNNWIGPTGAGQVGLWENGANWSLGEPTAAGSQILCIETSGIVRMTAGYGIDTRAAALRLGSSARLEILRGNELTLNGDRAKVTSSIPSGAVVLLSGGTVGGTGLIDMNGLLAWRSNIDGAATITSRYCGVADDPSGTPCAVRADSTVPRGLMRVGTTGLLAVDGRGANLADEYTLEVRGRLRLTNQGYVAADHGTKLVLIGNGTSGGRFEIQNDGGWYEGRDPYHLPLSTISNQGAIDRSSTSGNAVVAGTTTGSGTASVRTGTLALTSSAPVQVNAAGRYSSGRCDLAGTAYNCGPIASGSDTQIATVRVGYQDPSGAQLALREETRTVTGFGNAQVVDATGLSTSRSDPAALSLRYDASVRGGRTPASVTILHQHGSAAYAVVPTCAANGALPTNAVACVDRRSNVSQVLADGDLVMVVRTIQFSRWVAR